MDFIETTEVMGRNFSVDVDDMEDPDQYTEEVEANDDQSNENFLDGAGNAAGAVVPDSREPRLSNLPLSRIKAIMKLDPDFQLASAEAVFVVAKATELFIESLTKESFVHTAHGKKKTVQRRDIDMAIGSVDALMFLEGTMNT